MFNFQETLIVESTLLELLIISYLKSSIRICTRMSSSNRFIALFVYRTIGFGEPELTKSRRSLLVVERLRVRY